MKGPYYRCKSVGGGKKRTYDEMMTEIERATLVEKISFSTSANPVGYVVSCGKNEVVICKITFSSVGSWGTKTMIREANGYITTKNKGKDSTVGYSILHRFEGEGVCGIITTGHYYGGGICEIYKYEK